jgi:hypothetical protein
MCIALWVNYEETFSIALAFDVSVVAEPKAISRTRRQRSIQSYKTIFYEIFASSSGSLVSANTPKCFPITYRLFAQVRSDVSMMWRSGAG